MTSGMTHQRVPAMLANAALSARRISKSASPKPSGTSPIPKI
jgi:hypothetical protein